MKKRGVGLLLVLTIIIAAGTLGQDLRFDRSIRLERTTADARDRDVRILELALIELRASQAGYIATGQSTQHWMEQVSLLAAQVSGELGRLAQATVHGDARTRYLAAASALSDFTNIDSRARRYVADNQLFLASDLVFIDALEAVRRAAAELDAARTAERQASEATIARLTWLRFGMNSLALGFMLVVALVAVRSSFREGVPDLAGDDAGAADAAFVPPAVEVDVDPDADEYAVVVSRTPAARSPEPATGATTAADPTTAAAPPAAPAPAAGASVALTEAAELCVDLARLMDERDLPALVERTSGVLGAKGVVLWAADSDTGVLRPALTHGYSERVVKRLGILPVDGDNVTSLAYRSMRTQIMAGRGAGASGAVAVPLVTTAGCVGVLAAETREREPGSDLLALARILAAQFSTVVQPAPAPVIDGREQKSAEG
jgi:hypothetical protein